MSRRVYRYECDECGNDYEVSSLADECAANDIRRREHERLCKRFRKLCDDVEWRLSDEFMSDFESLMTKHGIDRQG